MALRRSVVTGDMGAGKACPQGDCPLCLTGDGKGGLRHHRSGAVYRGDCLICGEEVARYWGESGDSGYLRTSQHVVAIGRRDGENAFSKHLTIHHPEREGDVGAFKFTLEEVHKKPLPRLCSESVHIHKNRCDVPMNSKAEWHQPVVARVVVTALMGVVGAVMSTVMSVVTTVVSVVGAVAVVVAAMVGVVAAMVGVVSTPWVRLNFDLTGGDGSSKDCKSE